MKESVAMAYYAVIAIASIVMMYFALEAHDKRQLNCSIVEISPDFSNADRQRCRQLRIKQASQRHSL